MQKLLIANRGEIAVRIARACRDAGVKSVAVYSDEDRDALHVEMADEAFALDGTTAADTYLNVDKILNCARKSGADSVHPGYGFLSENANFAQAVIDAGLTWIGPPPTAIEALGDKVTARHIAQRVGAPLVPGTADPVKDASEVVEFAQTNGLPIAIKAAFGGGGRGLKVARNLDEIPEDQREEHVKSFRRDILGALQVMVELELAILDDQPEQALELLKGPLLSARKEGHKRYQKEEDEEH
ncbi:MAG: biotin carboxylase N-terminal domain-containing protein [Candidatus Nanopelagicales bacterium]|nr:biotin carboxylase N-terminal domain-containing protein [Candidatus Nanopelagicales bacterium]